MFEVRFTISDQKAAKEFIAEITDAAKQTESVSDLSQSADGVKMKFKGTKDELTVFLNAMTAHLTDKFKLDKLPIKLTTAEIGKDDNARKLDALLGDIAKIIDKKDKGEDVEASCDIFDDDEEDEDDEDDIEVMQTDGEVKRVGRSGSVDRDGLLKAADELIGAAEFKALIRELADVGPLVNDALTEVMVGRSYVFSIEDGHGLSTYLEMLGTALAPVVKAGKTMKVFEHTLPLVGAKQGEMEELRGKIASVLNDPFSRAVRDIVCFDISEWMGSIDSGLFRKCLDAIVEANLSGNIIVFRVPYVDKGVLARVCYAINDRMGVKAVSFPPFSQDELAEYARREFERLGFALADDAKQAFFEKLREEKSDGRFYGLRTVTKVVREMIYNRLVTMAKTGQKENVVNAAEAAMSLFKKPDDGKSAQEELDAMIGCENIKRQIKEIVAQILSAQKSKSKKRPCIHMRFVGSPGTGKTTIARILGKLLKEKGVLRIGEFYEHGARDLCGRYIGETSPKTSQICRDAYGSVLFLDEAYSLSVRDSDKDFGREAIDTLIAEMENHRDDFVVIMAGYTDEMEELMDLNPGLRSRMPYKIEFHNYSRKELFEIFKLMATSAFKCDKEMLAAAKEFFDGLSEGFITAKEFSNGRYVRNLFERTWAKAALRWQMSGCDDQILTKEDFDKAKAENEFSPGKKKVRMGFLA